MFFSGLFQRKSDAPMTTPAELADAIGLSYDTYTGKQISSQRAMRLTAVFSCVRVLAESVGMLPCNLYHLNGSLKQRATGERLHKLISTHPNGYMTPQEFWELVVTCLCLRGNFYAYKVKAFGEVAELLPVDPGCPERNRVLRLHAKVIRGHIHPLADQDAFIQFTGVRQNVGCAGLRLTNFHCGKYLYGPTSQPKLCGMSSFSTSVTDERFS